jgi:lipopolysaccharide assembly outer membrane protein LptD (OstA)
MKVRKKDKDLTKDTLQNNKKVKLLESLSLNTSYNLAVDEFNLSDISIRGRTRFLGNFSVNFSAIFDPYAFDVDSGIRINKFEIQENRKLARFKNANISLTGSLKPTNRTETAQDYVDPFYYFPYPEIPYADFDVPWNMSLSYKFNVSKTYFDPATKTFPNKITQTLGVNGSLSLSKNWKITGSTNFDFESKKFTTLELSVYRDLHCWEMSFRVIPFGSFQSYSFRINIKSSIFKGIEYKKEKSYRDIY